MDLNCKVKCNVCECVHNNCDANGCNLSLIEITHEQTTDDVVATPHFCKSFCKK